MLARNPLFLRDEEVERHLELLLLADREVAGYAEKARARSGLSEAGFRTLYLIQRHPDTTLAELGAILGMKKQSLSRHVRELVESGLLRQDAPVGDRRKRPLRVTLDGERMLADVAELHKRSLKRAFMTAGPEAVAGFERVLSALIDGPGRRWARPVIPTVPPRP